MSENQKNKREKLPIKVFLWEIVLFSLTLFLGIITAIKLSRIYKALEIQEGTIPPVNFWQFVLYFIIGTLLILAIPYFVKSRNRKSKIFKFIFIFAIFLGGFITLDTWIADKLVFPLGDIVALLLIIYFIFLWIKSSSILIHDICIIIGIAGMGATLGLRMNPETIILLLIFFSVYDFIAVYKTKHMVRMAKEMIKHQAILAIIIPKEKAGFKGKLEQVKAGGKFMVLGGGDIAFPLLFCVSLIPKGILPSLIVAGFSLIGLSFSYFIFASQKVKKPIPALPPIAIFSIIGFLVTLLL